MEASRAPGLGPSARTATGSGSPDAPAADTQESWRDLVKRAVADLRTCARTRLHLAGLESRRALQISAGAAVLGVLGGLLLITAWFTLIAAGVIWAALEGIRPDLVLLVIAVLCALGGWLSLRSVRAALARIRFDATMRALKGRPDTGTGITDDVPGGIR